MARRMLTVMVGGSSGSSYQRGDSNVNTWYEIDESGGRVLGNSVRPPDIGAKRWSRMNEATRVAEIEAYHDRLRAKMPCASDGDAPIAGHGPTSSSSSSTKSGFVVSL